MAMIPEELAPISAFLPPAAYTWIMDAISLRDRSAAIKLVEKNCPYSIGRSYLVDMEVARAEAILRIVAEVAKKLAYFGQGDTWVVAGGEVVSSGGRYLWARGPDDDECYVVGDVSEPYVKVIPCLLVTMLTESWLGRGRDLTVLFGADPGTRYSYW